MASLYNNLNSAGGWVLQFEGILLIVTACIALAVAVHRMVHRKRSKTIVHPLSYGLLAGLLAWAVFMVSGDSSPTSRLLRASAAGSFIVSPFFT